MMVIFRVLKILSFIICFYCRKVDVAVFRDLDSVITPREISAVSEWLDSKHAFHVMRDHPNHGTVPMMAGMWGVKVSKRFSRKGKEKLQTTEI